MEASPELCACSAGWKVEGAELPSGSAISLNCSAGTYPGGRSPKSVRPGRTWEMETPPPLRPNLSFTQIYQEVLKLRGLGLPGPLPWSRGSPAPGVLARWLASSFPPGQGPSPSHPFYLEPAFAPDRPHGTHPLDPSQAGGC